MTEQLMSEVARQEFVTEVLDESSGRGVLTIIVEFLRERSVENVTAEYGFVLGRDLRGEKTPESCTVRLDQLEALTQRGFQDGTIEWGGGSDFHFTPVGLPMQFLLCNDGDVHFSSPDLNLLLNLSQRLSKQGVSVYHSGDLVEADRVTEVNRRNGIGWMGVALLVLAWVSAYSTSWLPHAWIYRVFAIPLVAALVALVLAVACAQKGSRWWYLVAAASLVSELVLLGDFLAGD